MRPLQDLPLRQKQTLIIMLTSGAVLFLACAAFVSYDVIAFRQGLIERVSVLVDAIGSNCAAAIDFNVPETAKETLTALRANDHIVSSCVYSRDGKVFAVYQRDSAKAFVPPAMRTSGHEFVSDQLRLFRPINQKGVMIGVMFVASDLEDLSQRLMSYTGIVGLVFLVALFVAFMLSTRLQRLVSDPILRLANVARLVALEKDYSVRVPKHGDDELGQLVDGFNEMLEQIQKRDSALKTARDGLEGRVVQRTEELQRENAERKRAETFLNSVLHNLPITVFIKEAKDLRYVMWNKAGEELCGHTNEEMVGKSDHDFFPREQADQFVAQDREALRGGSLVEIEEEQMLTRHKGRRILHTRKIPIFGDNGSPLYLLGMSEDITQRKQAEAELAYERDLLRTLLDNSHDHIYFKDAECRFIKCSKALAGKMKLSNPEAAVGKSDFDFFAAESAREAYEEEQRIIRTGEPLIGRIQKDVWLDGRVAWVLTNKMPFRDNAGRIIGTFGISKDITSLKTAEAELKDLHSRLLDTSRRAGMAEVATAVLHNIGNVLNSVNVSATLVAEMVTKSRIDGVTKAAALMRDRKTDFGELLAQDARGRQISEYLSNLAAHLVEEQKTMLGEINSLIKHIEHIKDIVAMQQGYAKVSGVKEMVRITELVEDSLRINAGGLARHGVETVREYAELPPMNIEKHKILQILVNLVRNAKYACDESGREDKRLTVRVAMHEGRVRICVMDNGVGIRPENLARIFSFGFTTRKSGHGFGLHSGVLAARELGGSLTVHSDGPGQGARFTLELPCEKPPS